MTTTHVAAGVPLPPPVARPQDGPLRQDVRWLAATLGRVVGRLAGEETFRAVEELRRACRARRLGVAGAPDLDALLARTRSLEPQRRAIERHLEGEVELLWLTEEIRRGRPSVMDEVSNALWYLEDRLLEAASRVRERLVEAFEDEFGGGLGPAPVTPLTLGSWVGGDRDGNPFVTPDVTLAAARRARRAVLDHYATALARLAAPLSGFERLATVSPELKASLERDRDELPAA